MIGKQDSIKIIAAKIAQSISRRDLLFSDELGMCSTFLSRFICFQGSGKNSLPVWGPKNSVLFSMIPTSQKHCLDPFSFGMIMVFINWWLNRMGHIRDGDEKEGNNGEKEVRILWRFLGTSNQWKMTSQEDKLTGRQPQRNIFNEELNITYIKVYIQTRWTWACHSLAPACCLSLL